MTEIDADEFADAQRDPKVKAFLALAECQDPRCAWDDLKRQDRIDALQRAVDRAYAALHGSQYVGGPTEREAFQQAKEALSAVVTMHVGVAEGYPEVGSPADERNAE